MGGIATSEQLKEIQKVWKNLETGGNNKVASTVAKAVKEVGLFVEESDNDDEVEEESRNSAPVNEEEVHRAIFESGEVDTNKIYQMTLQILLIWNQTLKLRKDHLLKTQKKYCMSNPREND